MSLDRYGGQYYDFYAGHIGLCTQFWQVGADPRVRTDGKIYPTIGCVRIEEDGRALPAGKCCSTGVNVLPPEETKDQKEAYTGYRVNASLIDLSWAGGIEMFIGFAATPDSINGNAAGHLCLTNNFMIETQEYHVNLHDRIVWIPSPNPLHGTPYRNGVCFYATIVNSTSSEVSVDMFGTLSVERLVGFPDIFDRRMR